MDYHYKTFYVIFDTVSGKGRVRTIWTGTQHLKPGEVMMKVRLKVPHIKQLPDHEIEVPTNVALDGQIETVTAAS